MARHVKSPSHELDALQERTSAGIAAGLLRLAKAFADGETGYEQGKALRRQIHDAMQFADLLGRRRVLLEFDAAKGNDDTANRADQADRVRAALGADGPPFVEMIADLVAREPRLAATADQVARIYAEDHVFAAVHSTSVEVSKAVQNTIARMQREGIATDKATKVLAEMTDWSRWYAQTVFRTNVTTAYAAGRWKQVSDPVVREVVPAFRYVAVGDSDTRHNHQAADGLIAGLNDPIWERFTPPLGYNCRCSLELVDRFALQRMGLITPEGRVQRKEPPGFAEAGPDSNRFGNGRPDRKVYGF